jgi:hypothetical protein
MKLFLLLSSAMLIFFTSCKDKCKEAGSGGTTTIAAFPKHHDTPIVSVVGKLDTAYVKFNTQDFPGDNPAAYDLVIPGEAGEEHVHIENLKCGDYFIFMTGFDTFINERVTGGIPYSIPEDAPSEIDLNVPVTE